MKIFAAKLSPNTTSESLQALFEQFGEVSSSKVIMDRETGRSKCYGFIEMPDDEQARQALESLNGVEYEGSTIATKEAVPHDDYKKSNGGGFQRREGGFQRREGGFQRREGGYGHRDSGGGGFRPRREGGSSYGSREGGFQRRDNYSDRSSGYNRGGYNSHDGGDHSSENNF